MNGAQQTQAMSELMGASLAGFRVGDLCDLPTVGRCEVIALNPPSLLRLRTASGSEVQAGIHAVQKLLAVLR